MRFLQLAKSVMDLSLSKFHMKQCILDEVLCPVTEEDIPRHLRLRFEEEKSADAKKKKEKMEAHLFTEVIVCS